MIDEQAKTVHSPFALNACGVTGLEHPLLALDEASGETQICHGLWRAGVSVPEDRRGTHMSRLVEAIHETHGHPFGLSETQEFAGSLLSRLDAHRSEVEIEFRWFRGVRAPVTAKEGLVPAKVTFGAKAEGGSATKSLTVEVLAKALCPCSKSISEYGAHNQRSLIRAALRIPGSGVVPGLEKLMALLEGAASAPVFPILKREDEKWVTERAYDHPAFVEDIARNVAERLYDLPALEAFSVEVKNQESIHPHDCYAHLEWQRQPEP